MRRLWHLLAHLTGNFYGSIDSFWEGERLMMCFKCGYCGKRTGVHESYTTGASR